jgi:two-component system, NarL family, sensor kinase
VAEDAPRHDELSEQILAAEQDERRRIALFLHDGPVQSLSGIALMLDAALHFIDKQENDQAREVLVRALERHRLTIGELRDLSFNLEPVVLRDQGFVPAVRALADQLGIAESIKVEVDVAPGEVFAERAQVALYQLIREALGQAVGRQPTTVSVLLVEVGDGDAELTVIDDGHRERRRDSAEAFEERVRPLSGTVDFDRSDAGTTVTVALPGYAIR